MFGAKYIDEINSFTQEEFKLLGDFLNSKFFNKSKKTVLLYSLIKRKREGFLSGQFDKCTIYKKLYPGHKYHENTMYNLDSKMLHLLRQFQVCSSCKREKENLNSKRLGF